MASSSDSGLTYLEAGVDLEAADRAIDAIRPRAARTHRAGVMEGVGGFGALFSLGAAGFGPQGDDDTILVSAADGVGTKLKLAAALGRHDTIGIDCVAMCVNDVLTTGAAPLFFLDYIAASKLDQERLVAIIEGISEACAQSGCALVGGETAELPGMYGPGEYDVAGFCVGAVKKRDLWLPSAIHAGDQLIGLASSGLHSNGFSLVRAIIERASLDLNTVYKGADATRTLGEALLEPTTLYGAALGAMRRASCVLGAAHITGGGVSANLPRILPERLGARLVRSRWPIPPIMSFLGEVGGVAREERERVWNMGLGMIVAVRGDVSAAIDAARGAGCDAWHVGSVIEAPGVLIED